MSGITPILGRIAQIEARFSPTPASPARTLGVTPSDASTNTVTGQGKSASRFDMVMAAAESALGGAVLGDNGGVPPGLEFISSTGATPTPIAWTPVASAERGHAHAHDDGHAGAVGSNGLGASVVPTASVTGATSADPSMGRPMIDSIAGGIHAGTPFADEFARAGAAHDVPPKLLASVGWVESRYDVGALSPDGAIGLMQFMPETAAELGVNPHDPVDAIDGAARLLRSHRDRFGSWELALAAYFSGPGAVARNGNQAPPRGAEYAQRVAQRMETS